MLSLYLLRHGETEFSHQDRFCGRIDAPLTPDGREMAALFADAYGSIGWQAIVTSTRCRAIDSAAPTAACAGIEACRDARFDEMNFGAWQGLSKVEAAARDGEYFARWLRDPSIGPLMGESPRAVAARACAAIEDLCVRHRDGNILIVSHKALLRILLCQLFDTELSQYRLRSELAGRRGDADRFRRQRPGLAAPGRCGAPRPARPRQVDAAPARGVRLTHG